jgi:hypothetical protein
MIESETPRDRVFDGSEHALTRLGRHWSFRFPLRRRARFDADLGGFDRIDGNYVLSLLLVR